MKFYKWTVEIEVAATWVADGFNLTDDRAQNIMTRHLAYAYDHEIKCHVIGAPPDDEIATEQGYGSTEQWRQANKERR